MSLLEYSVCYTNVLVFVILVLLILGTRVLVSRAPQDHSPLVCWQPQLQRQGLLSDLSSYSPLFLHALMLFRLFNSFVSSILDDPHLFHRGLPAKCASCKTASFSGQNLLSNIVDKVFHLALHIRILACHMCSFFGLRFWHFFTWFGRCERIV